MLLPYRCLQQQPMPQQRDVLRNSRRRYVNIPCRAIGEQKAVRGGKDATSSFIFMGEATPEKN